MFQFSKAHWCERRIGAASGQAGPEVWPSRTHVQNGKRLAAYGDLALIELLRHYHFRTVDNPTLWLEPKGPMEPNAVILGCVMIGGAR